MILFVCRSVGGFLGFLSSQTFMTKKFDSHSDLLYARCMRSLYSESAERDIYLEPVQGFFSRILDQTTIQEASSLLRYTYVALHR
jgi:hypothetical protein